MITRLFNPSEVTATANPLKSHSLFWIAEIIREDWDKVYFGAVPYLNAMASLESIDDYYGADSGKSIVLYFLSNASTWRGDIAKLVKAELKRRCGIK